MPCERRWLGARLRRNRASISSQSPPRLRVCMCFIRACMYVCIYKYEHTNTQIHIHTCIHTYTCINTHTHMHTYIQREVEKAMLAVETGDWDEARSKIAQAKEMLARAGLQDGEGQPAGQEMSLDPGPDARRKVTQLSEMVGSGW